MMHHLLMRFRLYRERCGELADVVNCMIGWRERATKAEQTNRALAAELRQAWDRVRLLETEARLRRLPR